MMDLKTGEAGGHWSSPDHSGLTSTEVKGQSSFVIHEQARVHLYVQWLTSCACSVNSLREVLSV